MSQNYGDAGFMFFTLTTILDARRRPVPTSSLGGRRRFPCAHLTLWFGFCLFGLAAPGCDHLTGAAADVAPEAVWGVYGSQDGWLKKPRVAALDADGELYLADLTDRIQVFDRNGAFLRSWRVPELNIDGPSGLTVDRLGRVLVADTHFYRILVYSRDGQLLMQIGDGVQGAQPGRFGYPTDVVIDSAGLFYVSEYGENDRIQVFSPEGVWLRQWGGHGYEPGQMLRPRAMAVDEADRLYVADSCNHRIQVFDTQGNVLKIWGDYGALPGQLNYPFDIALGPNNTVYVVELGNQRVQKFTRDGQSLGVWGAPGRKPGQLNNPWALAVDPDGVVFVVDSNNHRVQRVKL